MNLDCKTLRITDLLKYSLAYFLVLYAVESVTSVSDILNTDFNIRQNLGRKVAINFQLCMV